MATNANIIFKNGLEFHFRYDGYLSGVALYLYNAIKVNKDIDEYRIPSIDKLLVAGNVKMVNFGLDITEVDYTYTIDCKNNSLVVNQKEYKLTNFINSYLEDDRVVFFELGWSAVYATVKEAKKFIVELLVKCEDLGEDNPNTKRYKEDIENIRKAIKEAIK